MSTDNAAAGMPKNIDPQGVLWGRQGLGAHFFGPEPIADAIWEVLKIADLTKVRGFTFFPVAFQKHNSNTNWRVAEEAAQLAVVCNPNIYGSPAEQFWGVGSYDEAFGLVTRNQAKLTPPPLEDIHAWINHEDWSAHTDENDHIRLKEPKHMPDRQISHMRNKRMFISRSGVLLLIDVRWEARVLQPSSYIPSCFVPLKLDLVKKHTLAQVGLSEFCRFEGAEAGAALLRGLWLMLRSSNYQVRQDLEKNAKAEDTVQRLLERIGL